MTGLSSLLCFLVLTFLPVIHSHGNHTLHPVFSKVLDNDGNYHLLWNFDDDVIVLEMRVRTTGYIGLGLSPNGGMAGSDIIVVGVDDTTNKPYIHDLYGVGNEAPVEDDHTDWEILSARQNETHTVVRVSRKLDTCDQHDRAIQMGTERVIWSYHPMDWTLTPYRYHGRERRGAKSLFLLNPQKVVPTIPEDSFTVDFLNSKVRLPSDDTTYWCQAFNMPTFDRKHHVIQFEAVIQPGNEAVVHHMTMLTCPKGIDNSTAGTGEACYAREKWGACASAVFGWGVGGGPFYFPEHVGYPIGIDDDPKLIILQTHFDNPKRRSDIVDSSGIRLTVTSRLRRHDAGMLVTGVQVYNTFFIPPHAEKYRVDGHCFAECLEEGMGNETTINIFATFLHTHLLGTAVRLRHFRHGVEQRPISDDENYDFNFQETRLLTDESRVIAGDNLVTECDYRTTHKKNMTFGGLSTSEEMCLAFVLYYPRVPISICYSVPPASRLAQFAGVTLHDPHNPYNNYVKSPPEYNGLEVQRVLADHVDWKNETNIARAQQEMTSYDKPVTTLCFQDLQHFFFREGRSVKPPAIKSAWRKIPPCSVSSSDRRHPLRDAILLALVFFHVCLC